MSNVDENDLPLEDLLRMWDEGEEVELARLRVVVDPSPWLADSAPAQSKPYVSTTGEMKAS